MSVILIVMYAGRVACCPLVITVSMPTGQTDRRRDGPTPDRPDRYITLSAGRGQRHSDDALWEDKTNLEDGRVHCYWDQSTRSVAAAAADT